MLVLGRHYCVMLILSSHASVAWEATMQPTHALLCVVRGDWVVQGQVMYCFKSGIVILQKIGTNGIPELRSRIKAIVISPIIVCVA